MSTAGATIDVGVDIGNPASVDKLFNHINDRLAAVSSQVTKIVDSTKGIGAGFDKGLNKALKNLTQMEGRLANLEKMATRADRAGITSTLDAKSFGTKVRAATDFSKSLDLASSKTDALQVRLNRLTETIARQGSMNSGQLKRMEQWEREKNSVAQLDRQYLKLGERAASTGRDFSVLTAKVEAANAKLNAALMNPRRKSFGTEIGGVQATQAELQAAIAASSRLSGASSGGSSKGPPALFGPTGLRGVFARTMAYGGAAAVGFGALSAGKESLAFLTQFEDGLRQLQAISGATDTQLGEIAKGIEEVGNSSKFSLVELTKMATILAQAGVSSGEMMNVLKSVNALAVASGSTADEAAQLVTSAIGSFQLQGSEAGRVADLLTEALNRTKLNVQQIGQAIQYVGATAYEENIPLEKVLATIGSLAQAGIKSGSTIGTGFRQFLVDLENPTKKMTDGLERFGLTQKDVDVSTRGLTAVIQTLKDAGIGSAQAFEMMERRGAAFYLVAKNNLDVANQLQIAFAGQNAAAEANAKAMDSVAAQWQRLKNLMSAKFWDDMIGPMGTVKDLLKQINDNLEGKNPSAVGNSPFAQFAKTADNLVTDAILGTLHDGLEALTSTGFADAMVGNSNAITKTSTAAERMKTALAKAGEAVDAKAQKVDALSHELERLYTQEEGIKSTTNGVAAETASLASRFDGLAKYLVNTTGRFEDLTNAMKELKKEEMGLLSGEQMNQAIQFHQARAASANQAAALRGSLANVDLSKQGLTTAEIAAIRQPGQGNYRNNAQLILDAADRLTQANNPWAETLRKLGSTMLDGISQGVQENLARQQSFQSRYSATNRGQQWEGQLTQANAIISRMNAMDIGERLTTGKDVEGKYLDPLIKSLDNAIANKANPPELVAYINSVREAAKQARGATEAAMKKTAEEIKEDKEKARAAKAAETAEKAAFRALSREDVDRVGLHFGATLGSGARTQAEQHALHMAGATKADGPGAPHVDPAKGGRDFLFPGASLDQLKRTAAAMQALADRMYGAGVMFFQAEGGVGKNNGTGPHVHGNITNKFVKKKISTTDDPEQALAAAAQQTLAATDAADISNWSKKIQNDIQDLKGQLDQAVIINGAKQASDDIYSWYTALRKQILDQASGRGLSEADPEVQNLLGEAYDNYKEKMKDLNQAVGDAVFKNFEESLKVNVQALEDKYNKNMAPFEAASASAASRISGYGYESNRNKIPDYVQFLAEQKSGQAKENEDRARAQQLTALINGLQNQLHAQEFDSVAVSITGTPAQAAAALADLEALRLKITELSSQRDALNTGLGAGKDAPQSISEGFSKASQAYIAMHGLNQSVTEFVNGNWTQTLDKLDAGFTDFFTNIITGSMSVKQAFGQFVKDMMAYIAQLIAKFIAMQAIKIALSALGGLFGGGEAASTTRSPYDPAGDGFFNGGLIKGAYAGEYLQGNPGRDSMLRKVAGGEFIVRKHAVDSVGTKFMKDLNNRGRGALTPGAIPMPAMPAQTTNVYVVKPDEKPQLGVNDVVVIIQDDILKNGQTKKLIKQVAQGG